jgi:hypothetical protein
VKSEANGASRKGEHIGRGSPIHDEFARGFKLALWKGFCQKIGILHHSSDLLDSDGTKTYLISEMMPFDGNVFSSGSAFCILIGNLESSLIVFADVRIELFCDNVASGEANTMG